jgi:hypothetical protein
VSALDLSMKMTIAVTVAIVAAVAPAGAQENIIVRRVAACIEQKDVFEFYKLSQENPSMSQVADFLQRHQCTALKSGDRVKIEQREEISGLYCVRIPERSPCYWVRRNAFKR